jgi:hypothetical protein
MQMHVFFAVRFGDVASHLASVYFGHGHEIITAIFSFLESCKVENHCHEIISQLHRVGPLLRSRRFCSYSRPSQHLIEPEGSSPHSKEPTTGSYSDLDQSSPYHPILAKIHFNIFHAPTS